MDSPQTCPSAEELAAYQTKRLAASVWAVVDGHVRDCAACQARVGNSAYQPTRSDIAIAGEGATKTTGAQVAATPHVEPSTACATLGQLREYALLSKLGEGGMGTVYRALHTRLDKEVALKVLPRQLMDDAVLVGRFQREMKAVGKLDHPNLVRATDAGEVDGTHFLVMELIEGTDLARLVSRRGPLPVADAAEIIRQAAAGLEHAHALGLIHRDVKPSNIMVTPTGTVKILDLGLALLPEVQATGERTAHGALLGSFDYIAPEQSEDAHNIDHRADLYSLGCTLFALLVGKPPFADSRFRSDFQKLKAHASTPPPSVRAGRPDIPEALAAVVARLLAKAPADRFANATEVRAALEPFAVGADLPGLIADFLGQPRPQIRPPDSAPPARPKVPPPAPRRRVTLWAGGLTALVGLAAVALLAFFLVVPSAPTGMLDVETDDDTVPLLVEQNGTPVRQIDLRAGKHVALKKGHYQLKLGAGGEALELDPDEIELDRDGRVAVAIVKKHVGLLPTAGPPGEIRRFENLGDGTSLSDIAMTPNGRALVYAGFDRTMRVLDATNGRELRRCEGLTDSMVSVVVSPDGRFILGGGGCIVQEGLWTKGTDFAVHLWDFKTGKEVRRFAGHSDTVMSVAFSPDGRRALSGSVDGTVRLWDVATGQQLRVCTVPGGNCVEEVAFSPDGRRALSANGYGPLSLWDLDSGQEIRAFYGHTGYVLSVAFSPDGTYALSGGLDRSLRLWDVASGREVRRFADQRTGVTRVRFAPDGRRALSASGVLASSPDGGRLTAGFDFRARLWDVASGEEIYRCEGHDAFLPTAQFTPDGKHALTADGAGTVRLWRLPEKGTVSPEPAAGRWSCIVEADGAAYQRWLDGLQTMGQRPVYVKPRAGQGNPRFTAIALNDGNGWPWEAHQGLREDEFQKAFDEWSEKGYRLISSCGYLDGDAYAVAGLWVKEPNPPEWYGWGKLNTDEYQAKCDELAPKNFRPFQAEPYKIKSATYFSALFASTDSQEWMARHRSTKAEYETDLEWARANSYRPLTASAYADNQLFSYVLAADQGTLRWEERHELTLAQFRQEHDTWTARGYRPVVISTNGPRNATRFLAVWQRDQFGDLPLPRSGPVVPELAAFDRAMTQFMRERHIPAGSLAVLKDGKLVLARGYGYGDRLEQEELPPDAPFRLASVGKAFTAAAVRKLIRDGKLKPETKVFPLLGLAAPPGKVSDPRLNDITIEHLLHHQGGWDSDKAGDPMFRSPEIAAALGIASPVSAADVVRYMVGEPLQFAPGSKTVYSNFGYCVLGRAIEKVTGKSYVDYLRAEILAPLGIKSVALGRTLPANRVRTEPYYADPDRGPNVMDPTSKTPVAAPDGTFCVESLDAHGGLIASAPDVVRFLKAYRLDGEPAAKGDGEECYFGSLPGTFTMALRRADGVRIAVLFNQRGDSAGLPYDAIRAVMNRTADSIKQWPTGEVNVRWKHPDPAFTEGYRPPLAER